MKWWEARFALKLGLTYGKLIPTTGQESVCPLTPALGRYASSDRERSKTLERRIEKWGKEKRGTFYQYAKTSIHSWKALYKHWLILYWPDIQSLLWEMNDLLVKPILSWKFLSLNYYFYSNSYNSDTVLRWTWKLQQHQIKHAQRDETHMYWPG